MDVLNPALSLAIQKVRFFPLIPNQKLPAIAEFSKHASSDPETIKKMFLGQHYNSAIACGKVTENLYLVGVDIDVKSGRNGFSTLDDMDAIGFEFPKTWAQKTASGGEHRLFWSPVPIRQGANVLGPGVDLRGDGGYLVGPGSSIDGKTYDVLRDAPIALAPQWFVDKYKKNEITILQPLNENHGPVKDQVLALKRSIEFLNSLNAATEGSRNQDCYRATAKMKDFGLEKDQMHSVLDTFWKCEPPLDDAEIYRTIESVFKTGKSAPGILAPENVFDVVATPAIERSFIDVYNEQFFFCNNRIYEESENADRRGLNRHSVEGFHNLMLSQYILKPMGEDRMPKRMQKSELWMESENRRTYRKIRFIPRPDCPKDTYNSWKGFRTKVADPKKVYSEPAHEGFKAFIQHVKENICDNDQELFDWLMDFTAHMFQKPYEKPPVACVFQGQKGTGKNVFIDVLKHMIGVHAVTISSRHMMTSNFNSMLEDNILVAFDEAFWSGDKSTEGILKSTITDKFRNIERKGEEPYFTEVYERIFILGNEERLVNATDDERRFAVFNISSAKRGDFAFFGMIMDGVFKHKSDELLMKYFMERDISKFEVRSAPLTEGLLDQKEQSLSAFESWWRECLSEGRIIGDYSSENWPEIILRKTFFNAFYNYLDSNNHKGYRIPVATLGKQFKKVSPICSKQKNVREGRTVNHAFNFIKLEQAQKEWKERTGLSLQSELIDE